MSRFLLKSVLFAAPLFLLYHHGSPLLFAEEFSQGSAYAENAEISNQIHSPLPPEKILVEVFLAKEYKKKKTALKEDWGKLGIKRVRLQFFRMGNPPDNMAIGSDIPASTARFAIEWALRNNKGVHYILPQFRFFKHHIVIGSSHYDEDAQIRISAEELDSLRNPELTTAEFHAVYRKLTGEDKGNPTYLDSERFKDK